MPSDTPILDLEEDVPKPPPLNVVAAAFGVFLVISFWLVPIVGPTLVPRAPASNPFLLLPAVYAAIAFHELGHFIANKLAGMPSCRICAGGVNVSKSGGHWIFGFDATRICMCVFQPLPSRASLQAKRFAWATAGGPLASLLLAGLTGFWSLKFGTGTWDWIGTLFWGAAFPLTSLFDVSALWHWLSHPRRVPVLLAQLMIRALDEQGIRPKDWDPDLMESVLNVDDPKLRSASMALFACKRSDDQRDDAGALQYLERALGSMAPNETHEVRRWCYFMAASMSALTRNNPAQARVWRERALKVDPATKPESTDGVDAAIAMAEGRFQDALAHWAAARELMGRGDSGIVRSAKEQIAELEDKCRAALSEAASVPASAPEPSAPPHTEETLTKEPLPWMSIALAASVVLVVLWAFLHR